MVLVLKKITIFIDKHMVCNTVFHRHNSGVDPGFLEKGFICIKGWGGVRFANFISFFLNIP